MFVAGLALLVAMIVFRRWRHLFTFLASVILLEILGLLLIEAYRRPRPYDVTIIGRWTGFSLPSATVAVVSFTVVGVIYALVVPGRPRTIAKAVGAVVIGLAVFARLYLGVDHPFDVAHRARHRRRHPAARLPLLHAQRAVPGHLPAGQDRSPRRQRAPGGGHPSCGRRPARPHRRRDEADRPGRLRRVDAAAAADRRRPRHVRLREALRDEPRACRPLVQARTDDPLRRLEDERPYQSVRRLVQYEDYAMRLLCDAGVPTAHPIGIVELTPEREYLMVGGVLRRVRRDR